MFDLRLDLPLASDRNSRLLPWLLGIMIYLAVLGMGGAMALGGWAAAWRLGLVGQWTILLPPNDEMAPEMRAKKIADLVAIIAETPGIAEAHAIEGAEMSRLLSPWLGSAAATGDLPLPTLIAVRLVPEGIVDRTQIRERIAAIAPEAKLDTHEDWSAIALRFIDWLRSIAGFALLLIGIAAMLAIIQVVRASLAIHRDLIEIVHWLGATDAYVARQFQIQALRSTLWGGAGGTLFALATLWSFGQIGFGGDPAEFSALAPAGLGSWQWLALAAAPLAIAGLAALAARWAVLRALARLP